ncbi:MAG: deaminase [Candidatus Shapirobacteria bacterium]|jgi:deoxycytidylate deaminase
MTIEYPYLPPGRTILYVPANNQFMFTASEGLQHSGCCKQATSAVIVKDGQVIGRGTNAGIKVKVCPRDQQGFKTGEGYHLCREICHQIGHAEVTAIADAKQNGFDTTNADLYLDGHWWCCEDCWNKMIEARIANVYLREDSVALYKK